MCVNQLSSSLVFSRSADGRKSATEWDGWQSVNHWIWIEEIDLISEVKHKIFLLITVFMELVIDLNSRMCVCAFTVSTGGRRWVYIEQLSSFHQSCWYNDTQCVRFEFSTSHVWTNMLHHGYLSKQTLIKDI